MKNTKVVYYRNKLNLNNLLRFDLNNPKITFQLFATPERLCNFVKLILLLEKLSFPIQKLSRCFPFKLYLVKTQFFICPHAETKKNEIFIEKPRR